MFEGQDKWVSSTVFIFFGGFVVFSVLRMFGVPLTTYEGLIWLFSTLGLFILMGFVGMRQKLKHQAEADDVEIFCDGIIRRGLITRDEFMLRITHMSKIEIDWEDKTLATFEGSKIFEKMKQDILRIEAIKDFHARRKLTFSPEVLTRRTKIGPHKGALKPKKTKTEVEKELTFQALNDTKKALEDLEENPEKRNIIDLPYAKMDLEQLNSDKEINKDKLRRYCYYFVLLKDLECFPDQTIGFDRVFMMIPGEKEQILKGYKRKAWDDGSYPIYIKSVNVRWNCLDYVLDNIPFLLLVDSENMDDKQMQEVITSNEIKYLTTQVLVHFLNVKRGEESQRDLKMNRIEAQYEKVTEEYQLLVQDIRTKKYQLVGNTSDQDAVKKLQNRLLAKTRLTYFAWAIVLVLIFCIIILSLTFVPSSGSSAPATPSEGANLTKTIFELFLIIIKIWR